MKFHPLLAPYKVAVFPLVRKDGLPEIAREIIDELKFDYNVMYDEKDSVGRRYRRHDAIGTPFCVTVDYESKDDNMVTIRDRDTMEQERIPISEVRNVVAKRMNWREVLG
jgi:glycyl-tRNA synthetase